MEYAYSDPLGFIPEMSLSGDSVVDESRPLGGFITSVFYTQQRYKIHAGYFRDTELGDTYESISFPNPKRGFLAITTYPPVYKTSGNIKTKSIVVPRKYPPIFLDRRQ